MAHMRASHKETFVANQRFPSPLHRAEMHGHMLPEQIVGTDYKPRILALVFRVLRRMSQRTKGEDHRARADGRRTGDGHVADSRTLSASRTFGPTVQNGPISTPSPSSAPGSTIACEWIECAHCPILPSANQRLHSLAFAGRFCDSRPSQASSLIQVTMGLAG